MTIYAISSLFQFINIEMLSKKPPYKLNKEMVHIRCKNTQKKYPTLSIVAKVIIWLIVIGIIIYEFERVRLVIQELIQ